MNQSPSFRDVEQLSAYLDNQSSQVDRQRLEARLKTDPELRALLADLFQTRTLLRRLPARNAPRNFRLTPEMAGIRPPAPRAFPVFQFASALAAVLFFFAFAANLTLPALGAIQASAPAPAMQANKYAAPLQLAEPAAGIEAAPTASETFPSQPAAPMLGPGIGGGLATSEPALPQPTEPAAMLAPHASDLTPTPELRRMQLEATQTPEMTASADTMQQPGAMPANSAPDLNPSQPVSPQPEPIRAPVPAWLQLGLLGLAVISGSAAYLLRARTEQAWFKAYSLPTSRPTARQMLTLILIILLVAALAIGILLLSPAGSYAP